MLLRCSIENWRSFKDSASFSMIASRERQHKNRIPLVPKHKMGVLPIAAIYGGNASGKTNFFKALSFARNLVVFGTQPDSLIPVDPFRLDTKKMDQPSHFSFEILINDSIYEFSFSVTYNRIVSEKLIQVFAASEKILYERKEGKSYFDKSLETDKALEFAFKGTRDNQLFLSNSVSQKIDFFRPIYNWFRNNLIQIYPDSRFGPVDVLWDETHPLHSSMSSMLSQLDTGINRLAGEEIPFDNLPLPESYKMQIRQELPEGQSLRLPPLINGERIVVTRKKGVLSAKKLVTYHKKADGKEIKFEIRQESDGSQRLFDLLPVFTALTHSDSKVFIIDELDRSLHTLLTRQLLEEYLSNCSPNSRAQLLFTTHDVLLMDQDLLRRDEMWITERDKNGASSLLSFSEYKDVRYDKDVRKSYLLGRLGGVPDIFLRSAKE